MKWKFHALSVRLFLLFFYVPRKIKGKKERKKKRRTYQTQKYHRKKNERTVKNIIKNNIDWEEL